jgi:hypothetical protein
VALHVGGVLVETACRARLTWRGEEREGESVCV